jgi:hypothetical protein
MPTLMERVRRCFACRPEVGAVRGYRETIYAVVVGAVVFHGLN